MGIFPMPIDDDPMYTPQYGNFKEGKNEFDLTQCIKNCKNPSLAASAIAFVLLRHLASPSPGSLESMLASERAGGSPQAEGLLKQVLSMKGISVDNDVLYGAEISQDIRQQWQRAGMDPESEDEVIGYLAKNKVTVLPQYDKSPSPAELKAFAEKNQLVTPTPPAPSPTKPQNR